MTSEQKQNALGTKLFMPQQILAHYYALDCVCAYPQTMRLRGQLNKGANDMTTSFQQYATAGERKVARRLIKAALASGYTIGVDDGEEMTVKRASKLKTIEDALCTTGEDTLQLYAADPSKTVGWFGAGRFYLVWGNADDGSELISDFTANDLCEGLWKQALGDMA